MKTLWLLLMTLLAASWLVQADVDLDDTLDPDDFGIDLDEDYDKEPLGDIEREIEELIEEGEEEGEEEEVYYEEDIEEDEEEEEDSSEERGGKRRNRKNHGRLSIRRVSRYMRRNNVANVNDVPGRLFSSPNLRRVHNDERQDDSSEENDEDSDEVRPRMTKIYRKVIRVVERRIQGRGEKFDRVCDRIEDRSTPRQGVVQSLPEDLRTQFIAMFNARRIQLQECCDMDGEEREECFEEAYEEKMDNLCMIQFEMDSFPARMNTMFVRMMSRRQQCCQILAPAERTACFKDTGKKARRTRRSTDTVESEQEGWRSMSPQRKVDKFCRKIDVAAAPSAEMSEAKRERIERHMQEMEPCCQMEGTDRLRCAQAVKRRKLEELCSETELSGPRGQYKQHIKQRCCSLTEEEKGACFSEVIRQHMEDKIERRQDRRQENREERNEARREGRREGRRENRRETRSVDQVQGDRRAMRQQRIVDQICRNLEQDEDWMPGRYERMNERRQEIVEERMEEIVQCCEMEGADRLRCSHELKSRKMHEICDATSFRGKHAAEKQQLKDRCCSLEQEEKEDCFVEALREQIAERMERKQERREERREGDRAESKQERKEQRKENRAERREERREGRAETRAETRAELRQDSRQRPERRRVRVEIDEEVARAKREIREVNQEGDMDGVVDRQAGRRRMGKRPSRVHHRRQDEDRDEGGHRRANRGELRACCTTGRDFGLDLDLPSDGMAIRVHTDQCEAAANQNAPSINAQDDDDKCTSIYKRCCVRSKFKGADLDDEGQGRRRHGRRRKMKVVIEEEIEGDPTEAIEDMIESAEQMIAYA